MSTTNKIISFIAMALIFIAVERLRPARDIHYRERIARDCLYLLIYLGVVFTSVSLIHSQLNGWAWNNLYVHYPPIIATGPAWIRIVLYFLLSDLVSYWLHRLMHRPAFWPTHRWHHSPTDIYWLSGIRGSVLHNLIFDAQAFFFVPLLLNTPDWLGPAMFIKFIFSNNFMHANVVWNSKWLEWVFVTPRYHHVHHGIEAQYYLSNFGAVFTFWDRLFGTYQPPNKFADAKPTFGIDQQVPLPKLVLGI